MTRSRDDHQVYAPANLLMLDALLYSRLLIYRQSGWMLQSAVTTCRVVVNNKDDMRGRLTALVALVLILWVTLQAVGVVASSEDEPVYFPDSQGNDSVSSDDKNSSLLIPPDETNTTDSFEDTLNSSTVTPPEDSQSYQTELSTEQPLPSGTTFAQTTEEEPVTNRYAEGCSSPVEKCKLPIQCSIYFSSEVPLESCQLLVSDGSVSGVCCPDVMPQPVTVHSPATGEVPDLVRISEPELDSLSPADLAASSEDAIQFIEDFDSLENRIIQEEELKLDIHSPEAGHLKVVQSLEAAHRELSRHALQLAATTKGLTTRLGLADPENELRQINVMGTRLGESCPRPPVCPPRPTKYRSHDGSCSNMRRPWLGRAASPTQRLLPAHYDDGVQVPRLARDGSNLPSAREISALLSFEGSRAPLDVRMTALFADFGQFIDHDLSRSPVFQLPNGGGIQCCKQDGSGPLPLQLQHPECMPIEIMPHDPFFSRFGQRCMNFVRTLPAPAHNCSLGPIQQMNAISHWMDGSMIYGSNGQQARSLVGLRGTLLSEGARGAGALLPPQRGACTQRGQREDPNFCFRSGDSRVNEQPLLTSLAMLFLREHNRIAGQLADIHPSWSDDAVYQETRRIVVAQLQHIVYNEFLPILLGRRFMETYGLLPLSGDTYSDDYNQNYDASITNEFAAAAFRLHTLIRGDLRFSDDFGSDQRMNLQQALNSPQILAWPEAGDALIRGQLRNSLGAFDHVFSDELTRHLFQIDTGGFGLDLLSLNIQRGRDHGLPGYNAYRKLCGLPRARDFDDLVDTVKPEALVILKRLYHDVEDIDLYVGGVAEKRTSGSLLGHTFLCVVGDQFARLKKGDRFFYDLQEQASSFSPAQLAEIRKASLARIVCDNSLTIDRIQPLVFWQDEDLRNPVTSCESSLIPKISLSPWLQEVPDTK